MSVDIFDAVDLSVGGRHEFDDPLARMRRDPRRLFEQVPAAVIGLDRLREFDEDRLDPEMMDEPHHILDADKGNEGERRGDGRHDVSPRSEEHTSELQSLMRISYAVFCLKKKTNK